MAVLARTSKYRLYDSTCHSQSTVNSALGKFVQAKRAKILAYCFRDSLNKPLRKSFFGVDKAKYNQPSHRAQTRVRSVSCGPEAALASWEELGKKLPPPSERIPQDTVLDPSWPEIPEGRLVFFRDRNGWCPYCERVWLGLLEKGLEFDEVLLELQGRKPAWYAEISNGSTPAIRWEDGTYQGESLDILRELDARYPGRAPLFPVHPAHLRAAQQLIASFPAVMPSGCRPSARTAFLFRGGAGVPAPRSVFEATLDKVEAMLGTHPDGPFFMGRGGFGAVDCVWAPFLERFAVQLPLLHTGLRVRDPARWPRLADWFEAMESQVPSYASRVQGSAYTWAAVLASAGYGNAGNARAYQNPEIVPSMADNQTWLNFCRGRSGLGRTPKEEVAMRMWRNREALVRDGTSNCTVRSMSVDVVDRALRLCVHALTLEPDLDENAEEAEATINGMLVESFAPNEMLDVVAIMSFNIRRVCVPRDMGNLPARQWEAYLATISKLAEALAE